MAKVKSRQGPCFCAGECPYPTRPTFKWGVVNDVTGAPAPAKLDTIQAVQFSSIVSTGCEWLNSFADSDATITVALRKFDTGSPGFDNGYTWDVTLTDVPNPNINWQIQLGWDDDDWPETAVADASCTDPRVLVPTAPATTFLRLIPLPLYICSQAEAEAWWDGVSGP